MEDEIEKTPLSRVNRWNNDLIRLIFELALLGLTEEKICEVIDVPFGTFRGWKKSKPEMADALKRGKEVADAKVVATLYQRAVGYEVPEEHVKTYRGQSTVITTMRHVPGDVQAIELWLKSRQPALWNPAHKVELNQTSINMNLDFEGLSTEDLLLAKKYGLTMLRQHDDDKSGGS